MLHDRHAVLSCLTIILVKGHGWTICLYSKLSTSVDTTDFGITSVLQTVAYRELAQENIDLNVLSVTITDMTCAPANCHSLLSDESVKVLHSASWNGDIFWPL